MIDNEFNQYDKINNRAYKLKYLRCSSIYLDPKYIQIYRNFKKNNNVDISKYYDNMKTDAEYPFIDDNGAYKIIGYEKDYTKVIGETTIVLDKIYSEWIDIWNELTN